MTARSVQQLDFGAFTHTPNRLFLDYLAGSPMVVPFFGAPWGHDTFRAAAERALASTRGRDVLAALLVREQERFGGNASAAKSLAAANTCVVITGQQAGLFGGPLLVLHKAIATLRLAEELASLRGAPVVPIFWVAADDHDFEEIRKTTVLDANGALHELRYAPRTEPIGQPAARIIIDDTLDELIALLAQHLSAAPCGRETLDLVTSCYRKGTSLSEAFGSLIARLLPGLVVLDSSLPELRIWASDLFEREISEGSPLSRLARETGVELERAGFHVQVPVREGFLPFFLYADGERRALAHEGDRIELRGTGRTLTRAELLGELRAHPELFSPGALLRPIVQDSLLPTAAYVGGPAEIAYQAQLGRAYAHYGVARPMLAPRPSVTLLDGAAARAREALGLSLNALMGDGAAILAAWARESAPEVETAFEGARAAVRGAFAQLGQTVATVDPTLAGAADSTLGRVLHPIEALYEKTQRALKRRGEGRAERLRRTQNALFPRGNWQERELGLIGALAKHGPALTEALAGSVDPWARGHQVITL
jgi:bacillithiol synthase